MKERCSDCDEIFVANKDGKHEGCTGRPQRWEESAPAALPITPAIVEGALDIVEGTLDAFTDLGD